jgi:hypothetical protein
MDASSKESLSSSHFISWWSPKRKAEGLSKQSGTKEIKSLHNNWNKEHGGTTTSNLIKMVQKKNKDSGISWQFHFLSVSMSALLHMTGSSRWL